MYKLTAIVKKMRLHYDDYNIHKLLEYQCGVSCCHHVREMNPKIPWNFIPLDDRNHQWPQIFTIFVASLSAFTCGALFTWTSPSIPILISNSSHINTITLEEASYFTVIPPISAALASVFLVYIVDMIGRKIILISIVVPQFLSWITIAFAKNVYILYLSRFFTGIGDAMVFTTVSMYLPEISEPNVRGSWGNIIAINFHLGQCLISLTGAYYTIKTTAMIFSVVPIICLIATLFLPESPYFLLMKNKEKEARICLQRLRWRINVQDELSALSKDVKRQLEESGTIKDLFTIPVNRSALLIALAVKGSQQLSGLPAFSVYTQYIFNQTGGDVSESTSAVIFFVVLVVMCTLFAFVVEKFERSVLMTFSSFACAVVLAIEAIYLYIKQETKADISGVTWIPLVGMSTYIVVFSAGLGIIPTILLGELFSANIKSKAYGVLQFFFSFYLLSVSKLFQSLTHNFGMFLPFAVFSFCCFVSTVFSYFCIPDTKGKTLEEIQQTLIRRRLYIQIE